MKRQLKLLFLAGLFLVFAQALSAQNFVMNAPAAPPLPEGPVVNNFSAELSPNFYGPENAIANNFYYPTGMSDDTSFRATVFSASGASSSAVFGFAQGDPDFVPSTYMNYNQALTLGNQILQQQNNSESQPSLGDIARSYRAISRNFSPETKEITVTQDNSGKMLVCKRGSGACA